MVLDLGFGNFLERTQRHFSEQNKNDLESLPVRLNVGFTMPGVPWKPNLTRGALDERPFMTIEF